MQPIDMIMAYNGDKKLKRRSHVLEDDLITMKKTRT